MTENFSFSSFTEVLFENVSIDLHNNYEFKKAIFESSGDLIIQFEKLSEEWVQNDQFEIVEFRCSGVQYLRISFDSKLTDESKTLAMIGIYSSEDREHNDRFYDYGKSNSEGDLLLNFEDDSFIRTKTDTIRIQVEKSR